MQDEDRPLVRIQSSKCSPDRVLYGDVVGKGTASLGGLGAGSRVIDRDLVDARTPPTAKRAPAGIDRDSPEPGLESTGVTEARQLAPCLEAALLDRVPGIGLIPDDGQGQPKQPVEACPDQRLVSGPVAGLGTFNEGNGHLLAVDHERRPSLRRSASDAHCLHGCGRAYPARRRWHFAIRRQRSSQNPWMVSRSPAGSVVGWASQSWMVPSTR